MSLMGETQTIQLSEEDFVLFQKLLIEESGLYFNKDKRDALGRALLERMKERHCDSFRRYYDCLKSDSEGREEFRELLDHITIGETYFFRGLPHFQALKESVFPEIIRERSRASAKAIRIWSAGCSTGDEPYSLAIALMETLGNYKDWDIKILATDINRRVLVRAAEGFYSKRAVGELPAGYLEKYFEVAGQRYRLKNHVKELVVFEDHNLARGVFQRPLMQGLDIIFCRNVTIYFDFPTTKKIIEQFYECLRPGGYLFIGYAETLWQVTDKFNIIEFPQAFVYQRGLFGQAVAKDTRPFVSVPEIDLKRLEVLAQPALSAPSPKEGSQALYEEASRLFAQQQYAEALRLFDQILAEDVYDIRAHLAKATILANEAKYKEAIVELEKIIKVDNLYVEAYYLLGTLFYKVNDLRSAETQFRKVIYVDPKAVLAYFNLGNIYLSLKKYVTAGREFRNTIKLLEKKPKDEPVRFCEDYSAEFLMRACRNNLLELEQRIEER